MARTLAVFRQNVRLLLGDPGPVAVFILTPLMVMAILRPTSETLLVQEGFTNANGSEQVVPGFAVMFAFFWISFVGRNFLAEHGWGTWQRLLTTTGGAAAIMVGKLLPALVIIAVQSTVLFLAGALIFGLESEGPIAALIPVALALIACVLSLTMALVALCRTFAQVDAFGNLLTMVFAALGGSLTPVTALPDAAQEVAPATPSYWALKAAREVILEGEGVSAVWAPVGVLLAFTVGFTLITMARFRIGEVKSIEA